MTAQCMFMFLKGLSRSESLFFPLNYPDWLLGAHRHFWVASVCRAKTPRVSSPNAQQEAGIAVMTPGPIQPYWTWLRLFSTC